MAVLFEPMESMARRWWRCMGESFYWANPGKREWIDCDPFDDLGFMLNIASYLGNRYTDAACTLLAGPWRGDPVMFVGDHFNPDESPKFGGLFNGHPHDDIFDNFRNVGGVFKCAEGKLRPPWEDGDDPDGDEVSYEGVFNVDVRHFRYAFDKTIEASTWIATSGPSGASAFAAVSTPGTGLTPW